MTRVSKCFVTPTLAYPAQVDYIVLHICFESQWIIEYMRWTCFTNTDSDSSSKLFCDAYFNICHSSRRKCVTYLFFILIMLLSKCVVLSFSVLLVMRVLKCYVSPTLTYACEVDENVLHICFDSHYIIEYMPWTCFINTSIDSRSKMLCYADFDIYRSIRRKSVTYLFLSPLCY